MISRQSLWSSHLTYFSQQRLSPCRTKSAEGQKQFRFFVMLCEQKGQWHFKRSSQSGSGIHVSSGAGLLITIYADAAVLLRHAN